MTSILDQYEQASLQPIKNRENLTSELYSYLNIDDMDKDEERPMFNVSKLKAIPPITHKIQFFGVGGEIISFITANNFLYVFNWKNSENYKEIDINKTVGNACKVKNLYMDFIGGHHLLITIIFHSNTPSINNQFNDLYYLNASAHNPKFKQINKMRGYEVTAVGWNRLPVNSQNTASILLGTSKGLIFQIEINSESEKLFQSGIETNCRQVFDIGKGNLVAIISGIEFHKFSNTSDRYFVLVTTANRLYQFVGRINSADEKPFLSQIFNNYLNIPEGFLEIPNKNVSSHLHLYYSKIIDETQKQCLIPKSLGWHINGEGIFYAQLQLEWEEKLTNVCIQHRKLDYNTLQPAPISFVLTEFHAVLLYPDRIVAISVLNKETVFIDHYDESSGKYINILKDSEDNLWLLSERAIYKGKFFKEDRFVWKIYLDKDEFSLAKKYCKSNLSYLRRIMKKEAEYYFKHEMYEESASLYAQIDGISFEETALKFLQISKIEALKIYLLKILEKLKIQDSTHITMITFWLIEIFEKQFSDSKFKGEGAEYRTLQNKFETFLSIPNVFNCIKTNNEIAYKILNSHGDSNNVIKLATMLNDYEKVIQQYLQEGKVSDALYVLKDGTILLNQKNLICSFISEFISMAPKDTVDLLIQFRDKVDPLSILPCLIFPYENEIQASEIIRYLAYCVHSLHLLHEPLHNYLIALYAKYKPEKIMQYLATQGSDPSVVNYEIRYALKLCQEYGLTEACVQLFALLGLWERGVDLALTVSVELAKRTASQPPSHDVELCKKLWLKIAQHVVHENNDIKQAMEFLQQCDYLVKIEDVLPFFNDFVTIDHFKDAICSSLQEYNQNIKLLKEEMEDATNSAHVIRTDIQSFKNRYNIIQSSDLCSSCNIQLLLRPFYIFPCSHYFHVDCLIEELKPYLNENCVNEIENLKRQISDISPNLNNDDISVSSYSPNMKEHLKKKLDSIIAPECFFCGNLTIEQIGRPFIEDEEFERICQDWE